MIPRNLEGSHRCGAKTRGGAPCQQPSMRGSTRCRMHGAAAPEARAAAERRLTEGAVVTAANKYGVPRQVTALDALEEELHRTQGHVDWLAEQIGRNPDPGWLAVYQSERSHLAKLSQQMLSAGVQERRVVMAEQQMQFLESALTASVNELLGGRHVDPDHVRSVLGRHLQVVADGASGTITAEVVDDGEGDRPEPVAF